MDRGDIVSDAQVVQPEEYAARVAYRDKVVATQYDQRRFGGWRGRLGDWLDRRAFQLTLGRLAEVGDVVLDIPCGTGRVVSWLLEAGFGVAGTDVSAEMIAVARDRSNALGTSAVYVQADAVHLPFRNGTFSCVTAIRFLGHVPAGERARVLREFARVSAGYVIVDVCVCNPIVDMRRRLDHLLRGRRLGFTRDWTWQSIPRRQLEDEFRAAGLQSVQWFAKMRFLSDAWMVLLRLNDGESSGSEPRLGMPRSRYGERMAAVPPRG